MAALASNSLPGGMRANASTAGSNWPLAHRTIPSRKAVSGDRADPGSRFSRSRRKSAGAIWPRAIFAPGRLQLAPGPPALDAEDRPAEKHNSGCYNPHSAPRHEGFRAEGVIDLSRTAGIEHGSRMAGAKPGELACSGLAFTQQVARASWQVVKAIDGARWPVNLDFLGPAGGSQADVNPGIARGLVRSPTEPLEHLRAACSPDPDNRTHSIAIRFCSFEPECDPLPDTLRPIAQNDQRLILDDHDNVHATVIIKVTRGRVRGRRGAR